MCEELTGETGNARMVWPSAHEDFVGIFKGRLKPREQGQEKYLEDSRSRSLSHRRSMFMLVMFPFDLSNSLLIQFDCPPLSDLWVVRKLKNEKESTSQMPAFFLSFFLFWYSGTAGHLSFS